MTRITGKTVDPGIDQDVITFQINGVERGRITGSTNTIGNTAFAIGSSYLKATAVSGASQSVAVTVPWTSAGSAGSDIAIDSASSTHINFLTTGWYSVSFHTNIFPDSGSLTFTTMRLTLNGLNPGDMLTDEGPTITPGYTDFENTLIEAGRLFTAGDFIACRLIVGADATWSYAETRLSVLRLS